MSISPSSDSLVANQMNDPIVVFVRLAHFTAALMVGVWLYAQPALTVITPVSKYLSVGSCNRLVLPLPRYSAAAC
jgi:hypothetical protein